MLYDKNNLSKVNLPLFRNILDFQYASIISRFSKLPTFFACGLESINILDYGSGKNSYLNKLQHVFKEKLGILKHWDPHFARDFSDIREIPQAFYHLILVIEVLEHCQDPQKELESIKKYLSPEGKVLVTVPFSARVHPCPQDFSRWTKDGLTLLFEKAGYQIDLLETRGNNLMTITNKLMHFFLKGIFSPFFPLHLLLVLPQLPLWFLFAHCSRLPFINKYVAKDDPLGFAAIISRKADD